MNRKSPSVLSTLKSHSSIPLRSISPSISPSPSINNTNISPITTIHRSSSTIPSSSSHSFTDSSNYSTKTLSSSTIPISNDYTKSYSSIRENNKKLFKKKNSINRIPQNNRFHSNSISTFIYIYIHNHCETTHYTIPVGLLPSSKYILYNIDIYSSNPSIDTHYSNNDNNEDNNISDNNNNNNEDNNPNIQSNDILDPTEHSFNIYIPLSISTEDQNYTINNSAKNDNNISYNEKNQSIMNNNNTNENNIAYNNNMVFISTINNMSSTNNNVITTTNNNINNNSIIATNNQCLP
ncbi:hypothetical protein WA158_007356 [Blastocystis sp. Blastoise]